MANNQIDFQGLRIFISYPRGGHGHTWAEKVQQHLEKLGAEIWRDEESIPEGDQDWYRRIETGVDQADLLTCILGHDSGHCDWQQREMLRAVEQRKPIVPLRIAPIALPLYVQGKQPVELRSDDEDTLDALAAALQATWLARDKSAAEPTTAEVEARSAPPTRQRQIEIDYCNELINGPYSDRAARYVPVEGKERQSPSLSRSLKGFPHIKSA